MKIKKINFREFKEEYEEMMKEEIMSASDIFLIIKNNKLIGWTQFVKEGENLFLDALYIKEKRKGYGKEFVNWLKKEEKEIKRIIGYSLPKEETISFWKSVGAKIDEEDEEASLEVNEPVCFEIVK